MIFVVTAPTLGKYTVNIVSRLFLAIVLIIFYAYMGTFLDINKNKRCDFSVDSIVTIIGIGLWIYTFLKSGKNLLEVPIELSEYWILFNFYYTPFTMIYFLLGITTTSPLLSLCTNLLPSLFMGCGLTYKRLKMKRKSM
ncbi:hypothetical protein KQI42_05725 [Tissierella sp. MSJ-40]|uniref:EamA domain-containing protein n=1 Tax=Tissierella simiarum TaxID=2841534 RepID=A0ABS6E3L4_9FIRM|nr:hypothetical protein [Tissierella simiarum]MBU5437495.1 hypothetical protein [Tissierella simiarum]